jgi:hypothetical protein
VGDEQRELPDSLTTKAADQPASLDDTAAPPAPWIGISGFLIDSQRKVIEHCRQQLAAGDLPDSERERLERVNAVAEAELVRLQPSVVIPPGWVDRLADDMSTAHDAAASDPPALSPAAPAEPTADPTSHLSEAAASPALAAVAG